MFLKLWEKIKKFCLWIWEQVRDVKTLVLFLIVLAIMYAPVWLFFIFYFVTKNKWFLGIATAYGAFWAGPFTPFFPLCVAITLFIKKLFFPKKESSEDHPKDSN